MRVMIGKILGDGEKGRRKMRTEEVLELETECICYGGIFVPCPLCESIMR
jgi:hypothetical protein